ncbi:MAG: hypothetical protein ABI114_14210 [Rhodanobacter sp.]
MTLDEIPLSHSEQEFRPLGEWAKRLSIPAETLLHHGSQGDLRLFTSAPRGVDYYSVYQPFVGNPKIPLDGGAQPVLMPESGVMGLVLGEEDCARLASGRTVEQKFFSTIIRKTMTWGNIIRPVRPFGSELPTDAWRIAVYKDSISAPGGESPFHSPLSVKIPAWNVYVRDVDIEDFIARLKSCEFIADLACEGRIVEEVPSYISGKLSELINANRIFWSDSPAINSAESEKRRGRVESYLKEHFSGLCDKQSNPKTLLAFAASAADPALVPQSRRFPATSVTPDMLALLTAAKLYWSAHCVVAPTRETYPSREAIVHFLRFMGLRDTNTASSGATLIRPEGVHTPESQPSLPNTELVSRPALRR